MPAPSAQTPASVATPPVMHHRQASQSLLAGKHVLVEKPLTTTLSDAEELEVIAICEEHVCVANLVERYNLLTHVIRRWIDSRLLGNLRTRALDQRGRRHGPPDAWAVSAVRGHGAGRDHVHARFEKLELYGQVVRDLAADQVVCIRDPGRVRRLTEVGTTAPVAMACQANRLAIDAP